MTETPIKSRFSFAAVASILLIVCACVQGAYTYSESSHELFRDGQTPTWAVVVPALFWAVATLLSFSAAAASVLEWGFPKTLLKWALWFVPLIVSAAGLAIAFKDMTGYFSVR